MDLTKSEKNEILAWLRTKGYGDKVKILEADPDSLTTDIAFTVSKNCMDAERREEAKIALANK